MFPKEHGAYGQLLFPLGCALAIGRPGRAALLLAAAAFMVFISYEPLLILIGRRGPRAARDLRPAALRWLMLVGGLALVLGIAAIGNMSSGERTALLVPIALAMVFGVFFAAGREHTTAGEIAAATALASISFPVALAGGASVAAAVTCAAVFAGAFAVATVAVHAVILSNRGRGRQARVAAGALAVAVVVGLNLLAQFGAAAPIAPLAALPLCIVAVVLAVVPPPAVKLRAVGWTLVATTVAAAVVLIAGLV